MEAIAAEASVTKPIVYRTLGDKEAVSEAVAEYLSLEVEKATVVLLDQSDDPRTAFYAAVHAYFTTLAADKELFLFVEHGWASPDGKQLVRMIERAAMPLVERFAINNPHDTHGPNAPTTWAYAVTGALRTVAMMWVREPYCSVEDLASQITDMFVTAPSNNDQPTRLTPPTAPIP